MENHQREREKKIKVYWNELIQLLVSIKNYERQRNVYKIFFGD
jgi:hypothetical protein